MEKHNKVIRYYIIVKCLESSAVGWVMSTYVLFLLNRGLTPAQATQVNTTFMLSNFIFDLPTGAIADIVGQFPIYIIGLLIYGLGHIAYGLGSNIIQFHFIEGTVAIGTSMMSEALESLLTNIIGVVQTKEVMAKEGVFTKLSMIPTSLLGSVIASKFGFQYPWFLGGITAITATLVGYLTLRKYQNVEKVKNGKKFLEHMRDIGTTIVEGTKITFSRTETRLILLVYATFALSTQAVNMFWAPVLKEISNEAWWLGSFWVGISLSATLGSILSKKIKTTTISIGLLLLSVGLPLILILLFPKNVIWVGSMFLLHEVGRGALPIILYAYLNKYIPDEKRSTSNSARGSFERIFKIIGLSTAGFLSTKVTLMNTWAVSGALLIVISLFVLTRKER